MQVLPDKAARAHQQLWTRLRYNNMITCDGLRSFSGGNRGTSFAGMGSESKDAVPIALPGTSENME